MDTLAIQSALSKLHYNVDVDGLYGRSTKKAIIAFQRDRGLVADGKVGPRTADALRSAVTDQAFEGKIGIGTEFPTQAQVLSYKSVYGDPRGPGGAVVSKKWFADNITYIKPPFKMNMGDIAITRIAFHKYAAPALSRVLVNLHDLANGSQKELIHWGVTKFAGTFNYRPMRGLASLSMHSFAAAIDFDPANNSLGDKTPRFAEFPQVLKAFADEGFMWGGDWNGNGRTDDERRCDGMHWQATRRA